MMVSVRLINAKGVVLGYAEVSADTGVIKFGSGYFVYRQHTADDPEFTQVECTTLDQLREKK
jgi:hypothetical protein